MEEENYDTMLRAFVMLGLAVASNRLEREELRTMPKGYLAVEMPPAPAKKLRALILEGAVTCIQPNPQPLTFIYFEGACGSLRCVWGVWLERKSSRYGNMPTMPFAGTADEARAAGIPVPDTFPVDEMELPSKEG